MSTNGANFLVWGVATTIMIHSDIKVLYYNVNV